jgi:hypothetical protein
MTKAVRLMTTQKYYHSEKLQQLHTNIEVIGEANNAEEAARLIPHLDLTLCFGY